METMVKARLTRAWTDDDGVGHNGGDIIEILHVRAIDMEREGLVDWIGDGTPPDQPNGGIGDVAAGDRLNGWIGDGGASRNKG